MKKILLAIIMVGGLYANNCEKYYQNEVIYANKAASYRNVTKMAMKYSELSLAFGKLYENCMIKLTKFN